MSDTERPKLILTEDDLGGAPPAQATQQAPDSYAAEPPRRTAAPPDPPQQFPTVAGVGSQRRTVGEGQPSTAAATLPSWLNVNTILGRSLVAATVGIAVAWGFAELIGASSWPEGATSKSELNVRTGAWVAVLGLVFAIVYSAWDQIVARSPDGVWHVARTSGPIGAALGFVSGFLAQLVFVALLENIEFSDAQDARLYLARGLAWGLFGMGMGAASAALARSQKKLINGLIGGAIGGAVGGMVFHWVGLKMLESQGTARLIGLLIVGAGIGLAIGLIETARRDAWLSVVAGGMLGKEFIIYAADTKCGSDPKCDIVLIKDPAIQPYHFIINTPAGAGQQHRTLTAYEGCAVTIQGQPVAQHVLRDGDVIGVGSTSIRYAERAAQQPLAAF